MASAFLGRDLKTSETRGIEDRVNLAMRLLRDKDPDAWRTLSATDRVQKGAEAAAQQMLADVKKQQQRVALTIAAHDRIENWLATQTFEKPGDRLQRVRDLLDWNAGTKTGGFTSAGSYVHALQEETFAHLIPTFESVHPKFFGLFENRAGVRDLIKELWGEHSGNADAKGGAAIWKKAMDEMRDRYNAAGGDIGKLDEWHYPQNHARERIGAAGVEKWISDTMPLLDRSKYMNLDGSRMDDKAVHSFMEHAYDTLITDGMNKMPEGPQRGYGLIANRHSGSRQIFFKDADSYLHYQGEYGDKGLWSVMTGHVRSVARDTALAEVLGPNPDHVFQSFNDRAHLAEIRENPTERSKLDKLKAQNEALFDYVSGRQQVVSQKIAQGFQAFRNFMTAAKLGKVVITALTDESGMSASAFANKIPWSQTFFRELRTLNPVNHTDRRVAEQNALGLTSVVGSLNRFAMEEFGQGWTSKIANFVMHASGAERMWDARRQGLGSVLMSYLGRTTREVAHFADIHVEDHGMLARKGVTEENWQVWRAAEPEDWGAGAHTVLTPKSIATIPDEKLDAAIAPRLEGIRQEAASQIEALRQKDVQDQDWMAGRQRDLQQWLQSMQKRLAERAAEPPNKQTQARLESIRRQMSALYDRIDTAGSYFRETKANQVSFDSLRRAAQSEGRNQLAVDQVAGKLRKALRDTQSFKEDLDKGFVEKFAAKEREIQDLIDSGDEGHVAYAMHRFNELFDEANARLTDRLAGADDKLTKKIEGSVARVKAIREEIQKAGDLWDRANTARPSFAQLRAQGVREGRAREAAKGLQARIRDIGAELADKKDEATQDLAERFQAKQADLKAFAARAAERMQRRQQVAERINRDLTPQLETARASARRQASTQLMAHVLEEAGMGAMDTGARQRVLMNFGATKGTVVGELARSAFLFKSFAYSMMTKHWKRASNMPTATGKWMYLSRLLVAGTIASAVGLQIRALILGQNPRNIADPRFWIEAILRGGGLGYFGDFLYDEMNSHDNTLIPSLAGPIATTAEDVWNLTGAAAFKHAKGKRTDEAANLIRFARGNIPGLNMWYTQAAMDHVLWNSMQDAASPGYLSRMQNRAYTQRGTSYYWDPHSTLPKVGPDIQQAWQPNKVKGAPSVTSLIPEGVRRFGERIAGDNPSIP